MKQDRRALLDLALRLILALGLVFSPLAHPLALAALATTTAPESACPHHASENATPETSAPAKPGDCCFTPGTTCHCAMTAALPVPALPLAQSCASEHPVCIPRLAASALPTPESPPPRR